MEIPAMRPSMPLRLFACTFLTLALFVFLAPSSVAAVDIEDTRMLSQPAVSADHVAFSYAGDLWIASRDGSGVRRLTTDAGPEARPRFFPDGKTLAFTGHYDGNPDVYTVAVAGGEPQRLTWHPGFDFVQDISPNGEEILFTSQRTVHTNRHAELFEVSPDGGLPSVLPIPNASEAVYSPEGNRIAYTPLREPFNQWKNYRGGMHSRIWIYTRSDYSVVEIPQPEGGCNDSDPMWIGSEIYFRSDRDGEFNLYSYKLGTTDVRRLTNHNDFPVLSATSGDGVVAYDQAGYLHIFDPARGASQRLRIGIAADLLETRPRYVSGDEYVRGASLSPSGARAALEFRGEIVTVPAKKGDPRNLTQSQGAHERSPAWSPDGSKIAYFSDASGEYALHVASQDGQGKAKTYPLSGSGFYTDPKWSPDGKKISFTDNSWTLYVLDLESGDETKVSTELVYGPVKTLFHSWSPDSRWLAYTKNSPTYFQRAYLYEVSTGKSQPVTDGLSDVAEPTFDASGKYLYLAASTDAGPVLEWFSQSNSDMSVSRSLYLAVLPSGEPSPPAAESDEEEGTPEKSEDGESKDDQDGTVVVDFDRLEERILALPVAAGNLSDLKAGKEGTLFYMQRASTDGLPAAGPPPGELMRFDLKKRKAESIGSGVESYSLSPGGEQVLARAGFHAWKVGPASGKVDSFENKLDIAAIEVKIDPRKEWRQIFEEAWRINRDFFYDPGMHGADWPAMREKYREFLPHVTTRGDLNQVIQWMCSELAVGHHRVFGGDRLGQSDRISGGLLGADYEVENGRYRISKVYGGLNWNPSLRSPLTEPGVEVEAGEYLLAVNGRNLVPPRNIYSRFENSAGKIISITVGPNANGSGSRTVQVVPVSNENALRNRDWVEGNLRKVDEATDGRVAYVHVPDTWVLGHTYFKRYFFPQAHKEAIIVDERFNGGGLVADYYIDILGRSYTASWATRYGADVKTPISSIQGPKAMLIDETAGSGGDMLPWMFRQAELGPLIGKRTWGGLVGILGFPVLMDGGQITAPDIAFWTEEEGFGIENVGVPPDIEVEMMPAEVAAGRDPQLEKAIEVILQALEENPPKELEKPDFPIRVWQGK